MSSKKSEPDPNPGFRPIEVDFTGTNSEPIVSEVNFDDGLQEPVPANKKKEG